MKLTLLLLAALPALAQEIKCDGYDIQRGALKYACAWVDYAKLVSIGLPWSPDANGIPVTAMQVWVRTIDVSVTAFSVAITFDSDHDGPICLTALINRNPNPTYQSIAEFRIGKRVIKSIKIQELKPISMVDW